MSKAAHREPGGQATPAFHALYYHRYGMYYPKVPSCPTSPTFKFRFHFNPLPKCFDNMAI